VGELTDDHQQQRLAQYRRKLRECPLHLVGELILDRIDCRNWNFEWSMSDIRPAPASSPPTVDDSPPQDGSQPGPLSAAALKAFPVRPGTAQSFLHNVLGIVTIAHHAKGDTIQCRGVLVDQDDKVAPRKRHPLPLSFLFRSSPVAKAVTHFSTWPASQAKFVGRCAGYSRPLKKFPNSKQRAARQAAGIIGCVVANSSRN
jgi:hypothetical protein